MYKIISSASHPSQGNQSPVRESNTANPVDIDTLNTALGDHIDRDDIFSFRNTFYERLFETLKFQGSDPNLFKRILNLFIEKLSNKLDQTIEELRDPMTSKNADLSWYDATRMMLRELKKNIQKDLIVESLNPLEDKIKTIQTLKKQAIRTSTSEAKLEQTPENTFSFGNVPFFKGRHTIPFHIQHGRDIPDHYKTSVKDHIQAYLTQLDFSKDLAEILASQLSNYTPVLYSASGGSHHKILIPFEKPTPIHIKLLNKQFNRYHNNDETKSVLTAESAGTTTSMMPHRPTQDRNTSTTSQPSTPQPSQTLENSISAQQAELGNLKVPGQKKEASEYLAAQHQLTQLQSELQTETSISMAFEEAIRHLNGEPTSNTSTPFTNLLPELNKSSIRTPQSQRLKITLQTFKQRIAEHCLCENLSKELILNFINSQAELEELTLQVMNKQKEREKKLREFTIKLEPILNLDKSEIQTALEELTESEFSKDQDDRVDAELGSWLLFRNCQNTQKVIEAIQFIKRGNPSASFSFKNVPSEFIDRLYQEEENHEVAHDMLKNAGLRSLEQVFFERISNELNTSALEELNGSNTLSSLTEWKNKYLSKKRFLNTDHIRPLLTQKVIQFFESLQDNKNLKGEDVTSWIALLQLKELTDQQTISHSLLQKLNQANLNTYPPLFLVLNTSLGSGPFLNLLNTTNYKDQWNKKFENSPQHSKLRLDNGTLYSTTVVLPDIGEFTQWKKESNQDPTAETGTLLDGSSLEKITFLENKSILVEKNKSNGSTFKNWKQDKDGNFSADTLTASNGTTFFKNWKKDKDGNLSADTLTDSNGTTFFKNWKKDKDGNISADTLTASNGTTFKNWKQDKDGNYSADTLTDSCETTFKNWKKDKDGNISADTLTDSNGTTFENWKQDKDGNISAAFPT